MVPTVARCGCPCHPDAGEPCVYCELDPRHTARPVPPPARDPRRVRAVERSRAYRERIRAEVLRARADHSAYSPGVSAGDLPMSVVVPDNGGVEPTQHRGPAVSLPDSSRAAA